MKIVAYLVAPTFCLHERSCARAELQDTTRRWIEQRHVAGLNIDDRLYTVHVLPTTLTRVYERVFLILRTICFPGCQLASLAR